MLKTVQLDQMSYSNEKNSDNIPIAGKIKGIGFKGNYRICMKNENVATGLKTDCAVFSDKSLGGATAAAEAARNLGDYWGNQMKNIVNAQNAL